MAEGGRQRRSVGVDPRLRERKHARGGRERMLDAAADLIALHGITGTTVQMIAERLGVTKAAVFYHFKTRDDIIEALLEPIIATAGKEVTRLSALPEAERLPAALTFLVDFVVRHRKVVSAAFFNRGALQSATAARLEDLTDAIVGLLTAADGPGSDATARVIVYGLAATVADRTRQAHSDARLRAELAAAVDPWQRSGQGRPAAKT